MKCIFDIDRRLRLKFKDRELIDHPVIIRVNKFDEQSADDFALDMSDAHNTGQSIIPIVIDSYGGHVYSLMAMVSEIENSQLPVATIVVGKAMSCGAVLLSCGSPGHRYIDNNAIIMMHDVSGFEIGKNAEIKATAREVNRLNRMVFQKMAKSCGHKDKNYFLKLIHSKSHADWYVTPTEAVKHGIANHIGSPSLKIKISMEATLGL